MKCINFTKYAIMKEGIYEGTKYRKNAIGMVAVESDLERVVRALVWN